MAACAVFLLSCGLAGAAGASPVLGAAPGPRRYADREPAQDGAGGQDSAPVQAPGPTSPKMQFQVKNGRTVRVAYTQDDRLIYKGEDGKLAGYGVAYLETISAISGWKVEYVELRESEKIMALLNGKVDLLCDVHKSDSRHDDLVYSAEYGCLEYGMLCAREDNGGIFYDDFDAMQGKKIGIDINDDLESTLEEYARENDLEYKPVYYDSAAKLMSSLENGKVDMALVSSQRSLDGCKYVGKTGIMEQYFVTRASNRELIWELNRAEQESRQERPFYVSTLYTEYFGQPYKKLVGTTREEHEYIEKKATVRVVCDSDSYPIEYVDPDTGKCMGVYIAAARLIEKRSGLHFKFIPNDNLEEALEMVSEGKADIIMRSFGNDRMAKRYNLSFTESYMTAECAIVGREGMEVRDGMTVAILSDSIGMQYFFRQEEPTWKFLPCDSVDACLKAVEGGRADVTAVDSIYLQTAYSLDSYDNLMIVPNMSKGFPVRIGVGIHDTEILAGILNKAIYQIPASEFDKCVAENALNVDASMDFAQVAKKYFPEICFGLFALVSVTAAIIFRRERHFQRLAMTDSVTGLWSRRKFFQEAQEILEKNKDKTYLLITMDINKFKFINNDFGAETGDKVLFVMGERVQKIFAGKGCYARNRADLFMALIEESRYDPEMLEPLSRPIYINNNGKEQSYKVVVKAGIRQIGPEDKGKDMVVYVDQSTLARKSVKDSIHKSVAYYDEGMKRAIEEENAIEKRMEEALARGEFQVYLQPKCDLRTDRIKGAEALVRWIDPEKGMIPPDHFIPLFEKNGFVLKLDFFVYEEVLRRMAKWMAEGRDLICVSVNVSRVHIGTTDFFERLNRLLDEYKVPKKKFELELTETIMGGKKSGTREFIKECKREGFPVSIDDFGSGYSSLNLLKDLPVDILKIDKEFLDEALDEAEGSKRSTIIVEQVVEMAKRMDIATVCEGVETRDQAEFLKRIGCDMAQGYLFSKPVPMDEFEAMLQD